MSEPVRSHVRVRYGETDQMGVVYHANYIVYFEIGRTELMRSQGLDYAQMEQEGISLAVIDVGVRYHRPARYDDQLSILTRLTEASGVRARFEYRIERQEGDEAELICTGHTTLASIGKNGRPMRIPSPYQERIAAALG